MIDHASEMAAFVRVVEAKGFSAAAPALGLTPSAVSKLVTRLEARLGVRLLQRTTRALHLTADGEAFYEQARRIVGEIAALEAEITDRRGTPQGLLRVTTSLAFSTHQLAPVDRRIPRALSRGAARADPDRPRRRHGRGRRRHRHPDRPARRFELHGAQDRRGRAAGLRRARLSRTPRQRRERPEDLVRHNCIVSRDRAHLNRWQFRIDGRACREIEVGGRIAVSDGEAQLRLALQGLGIVRLTRLTVAGAIRRGELVSLLKEFSAEEPVPIHAVYPHRRHLAPKVTAFVDFIRREVHAAAVGKLSWRAKLKDELEEDRPMPDAIDELFRRFGKAFNKADVEEIAACVTDDFEWRLAGGRPALGHACSRARTISARYFADKSQAHREARYSEARIHRAGDKLFGTFRVTGIDAKGQPFDRYGIDLYELKDGKIALKDSYLKVD